jgi:HSP20 family protein
MRNDNQGAMERQSKAEAVSQLPQVAPPVDVYETRDEYLLVADVPGVTKDSLSISVEKGQLSFEGKRGPRKAGEPTPLQYRRSFVLPRGIDESKIEAELTSGVLKLRLPKADAQKPKKITIRAS